MSVKSLDLTWICVSDLKKAIKYYTEVLGLKLREECAEYGWAELSGSEGGARLGLAQHNSTDPIKPGQNGVFTLTVDNLEAYKKRIDKKNVAFLGEPMEVPGQVKLQTCKDQDNNLFQVVEILDKTKCTNR